MINDLLFVLLLGKPHAFLSAIYKYKIIDQKPISLLKQQLVKS